MTRVPVPDSAMNEAPPALTLIREAISKLKGEKAVGIWNIPVGLLESSGTPLPQGLNLEMGAAM